MYFLAYLNSEVPDKNTLKTGLFTHPKRLLIPTRGLCGENLLSVAGVVNHGV